MKKKKAWLVYIIKCGNGALYTGVTNDLERRLGEHRSGKGAKFTRSFGVKGVVYSSVCRGRSSALKREAAIKRLTRKEKLTLIRKK